MLKADDWLRTRVREREMCVGGAVGARRWCGSGWVVFGCVVVRGGRVLGRSNFFSFWLVGHVRVGDERGWEEKKRKCIKINIVFFSCETCWRERKRKESTFKII